MTALDMVDRCQQRLHEDPAVTTPVYYPYPEVLSALNRAQRMFVLLTLCLETTVTFDEDGSTFYNMRTSYEDWLLPLRVSTLAGVRVRPARLADLDALDSQWQANVAPTKRYAALGFDFFVCYPQQSGMALVITYAQAPPALVNPTDVPVIPEDYHPALPDFAIPWLRLKEGGQEFQKSLPYLKRFFAEADREAEYVRQRNIAARYDNLPFELRRLDRSKFLGVRPDLPSMKGSKNG
ncbi:MAG TPA: hypothetical protein VK752_05195 [Bryobacteraceae bacterium]|jgi:hypothetical protein|nr:hypothetical protein [Bryobacteraceae bacterium]